MGRTGRAGRRVRSAGAVLWRQFCKYCSCTALHGYQYMTEPGRPLIERLLWLVCHCCALAVASVMVYGTWRRYEESPTVTAVETTHYPVWRVPFPAITICDPNQVTTTGAKRLAKRMSEGNSNLEKEYLESFVHLRELLKHEATPFANVSRLHGALKKTGLDVAEIMRELAPNCVDIFESCNWKGQERPCGELFHQTKTDNGFCCSFNYVEPCAGRACGGKPTIAVPQYTSAVGNKFGLRLMLRFNNAERFVPSVSTDALRVMVHGSFLYPSQWSATDMLIQRRRYMFIRVLAESSYSTEAVRKLPFQKSACVYEERADDDPFDTGDSVGDFKQPPVMYSRDNCLMECRRRHFFQLCGCQPYYYPSVEGVRFCDLSDLICINRYKVLLSRQKPPLEELAHHLGKASSWDSQEAMECDCPAECNELSYRFGTTDGILYSDASLKPKDLENTTVLYIFFGKMYSTRYRRDLLLSWDTMLSNAGGLFGLFMGFSLISVVEAFYFFTLRLYHESSEQRKSRTATRFKKWSGMAFRNKMWPKTKVTDDFGRQIGPRRRQNFVY